MSLWFKLSSWWRKSQREKTLRDELQGHLDELAARHVAAGMAPDEAQHAAQRQFGNVAGIQEQTRETWSLIWLEHLWRDFRFSTRSLRRSLAFSGAIVVTLGLCIWANTAILAVLYGLVLKPLPFPDPGQLVDVYNTRPKQGLQRQQVSYAQYLDYRANADLFASFGLGAGWMFNIEETAGMERYVGMRVSADYFPTIGVQPLLGRFFTEDECTPGRDNVVVLTESFWEKQFLRDPAILGREVKLTGRSFTVIGVLPRRFEALSVAPVLLKPFEVDAQQLLAPQLRLRGFAGLNARLKPGVAPETALAQLQLLEDRFRENVADPALRDLLASGGHRMALRQLRAEQTQPIRNGLLLLQVGALFVLLLGCVNVASLMLARSNARQTELAVRQALGGSRTALARQLFVETALLAGASTVLGLGLAGLSLRLINMYTDKIIFGIPPVRLDADMLVLTLAGSFGVALLTGLLPVIRLWQSHSFLGSIQNGTRASSGRGMRTVNNGLVVAQLALALILLVGAGLLFRSFTKVMQIDAGFDAAQVIHVRVAYNSSFNDVPQLQSLQNRILEKMREIPGVESVAYSASLPGFAEDRPTPLRLRGMTEAQAASFPTALIFPVSPEYLPTMGIRLLEGRNFTSDDLRPNARAVLIVDRKFAEKNFPGRSAVGEMLAPMPGGKPEDAPIIVGVADIAKVSGLEKRDVEPYVYVAFPLSRQGLSVELRTSRPFAEVMPQIRSQLRAVEPTLPIYQAQTMQMRLDDAAANRRGILCLLGAFAGISVLLAAVGLYGMLAYDVTQRTKEIGIRAAIGATREEILRMILQQGLLKAIIGLVLGLGGAWLLSRYIATLLYEVEPNDPLIFGGVAATLLVVGLLASWLPARRAAQVDPLVALRHD